MTYSPFIPATIPADDQEDILSNFKSLNDQFTINHTAFDAVSKKGYHKKLFFFQNNERPDKISPRATLYPRYITYNKDTPEEKILSELFFQNANTAADERLLVDLFLSNEDTYFKRNANGCGFKTPWGLIMNMGQVKKTPPSAVQQYTWPMPYTSIVYTVIISSYTGQFVNLGIYKSEAFTRNVSLTNFELISQGASSSPDFSNAEKYYYLAIGK